MSIESAPAEKLVLITPSDSTIINVRALWVGGAGNISVIANDDTAAVTISGIPAGTLIPVSCQKVMAATTATLIVGLIFDMLGLGFGLTSEGSLRRAAGGTWTPLDLGVALKAWWNADDHGTANMTDDGAGLISSWKDRITGINAIGATTARPTWAATSFNSAYPGVTGNGTSNVLSTSTYTGLPVGSTGGEIWMLCNSTSVVDNSFMFMYGPTGAGRYIFHNTIPRMIVADGTTTLTVTSPVFTGNLIVMAYWVGTTEGARINGQDTTPATAVIGSLNTTAGILSIFARNSLNFWAAYTARHIFVTTILTAGQREQMEGWCAWNHALTSLLPGGHPYKLVRP